MKNSLCTIERCGQMIVLPKAVLEEIYSDKSYITLNKIKRSWGTYHQVMVCKKRGGKLVL